MAGFFLSIGSDTVTGTGADETVNGTAATLNAGDRLTGGTGNDVLALYGSGTFHIDQLTTFTGFESVTLNNFTAAVSLYLGSQPVAVTGTGSGAEAINLGSGATTFHGGDGPNTIISSSAANWNADNVIDGSSSPTWSSPSQFAYLGLNLNGAASATYDLRTNTLTHIPILLGNGDNLTVKINSANAAGIFNFWGLGANDQLVTSDTSLDLSHSTVTGFTVASTNLTGTTFSVQDIGTAFQIAGGPGQDTITTNAFAFTAAQRNALFGFSSIEKIIDTSGTFIKGEQPPAHWMASSDIGPHPAGWLPISTGDFNHDATNDVLWFNSANLDVDLWKIQNGKWAGSVDIGTHPAGYQPSLSGDFNNDGTSDVLWYNPSSGDVDIWKISNGQWAGSVAVGLHPLGYQPAAAGDFNNDGTSDVLWFNPTNGDVDIWKISNGQWAGSVSVGPHPLGYTPVGVGDFDHDGTSDVLWYNPTTRDVDIWRIANGHWAGSVDIGTHPAGWAPASVGDFNQDGTSDVVWFNAATGNIEIWLIANGHWSASVDLGTHPAGWLPAGVGDFDHNGTSDILWREAATNHTETWLLSNS